MCIISVDRIMHFSKPYKLQRSISFLFLCWWRGKKTGLLFSALMKSDCIFALFQQFFFLFVFSLFEALCHQGATD